MAWVVLVGPCRACRVERREKLRKGEERRGEESLIIYPMRSYPMSKSLLLLLLSYL